MPLAKRRSEQEIVFTTNNTRPNQKINRLNQRALIFTQGLTTAALQCTVRPNFSSSSPNHNRSIKNQNKITSTNNPHNHSIKNNQKTNRKNKHDKLSHQSIAKTTTTNNPHNLSIKSALKTNHYNKHNNPSRHTPRFLNIKIIDG